jgi:hypothetical protein
VLMFRDARAGVAITMSGESARRERWTASETFCVRLTARISLAQKEENDSTALCTCSASSLVGTRTRADVPGAREDCSVLEIIFLENDDGHKPLFSLTRIAI